MQFMLSAVRKQLASRFNFTYRYIDDVLSINNPEFENYLVQMFPVEHEIKDTTESSTSASYPDLLLSIGRDGQLHTLPYMTNVTILISTSQLFHSWVAIFHPCSPMASLFRSLHDIPGPANHMDVLFLRRRDFQITFPNRERLKLSLRKFYGRYGDLIKQYEVSLSRMLNDILWPDHIQWQPSTDQTLYHTQPFPEFWEVSIENLRRVWHADNGRLLFRTPGPVPLVLAHVLLVETNPFSEIVVIFPDYAFRISLGTFSILLGYMFCQMCII